MVFAKEHGSVRGQVPACKGILVLVCVLLGYNGALDGRAGAESAEGARRERERDSGAWEGGLDVQPRFFVEAGSSIVRHGARMRGSAAMEARRLD